MRQPEGGEQQAILGEDDEVHADADGERPRETARLTDEPARVVLRAREDVHPATYDAQPVEPRRARRRGHEPAPLAETPDGEHHADGERADGGADGHERALELGNAAPEEQGRVAERERRGPDHLERPVDDHAGNRARRRHRRADEE